MLQEVWRRQRASCVWLGGDYRGLGKCRTQDCGLRFVQRSAGVPAWAGLRHGLCEVLQQRVMGCVVPGDRDAWADAERGIELRCDSGLRIGEQWHDAGLRIGEQRCDAGLGVGE